MSAENLQRVFVFKTKKRSADGRPYLMAFPESQITSIKSLVGAQRLYLEVNGVETEESFEDFVKALGTRVNAWEL